jgi:hypothetical protein
VGESSVLGTSSEMIAHASMLLQSPASGGNMQDYSPSGKPLQLPTKGVSDPDRCKGRRGSVPSQAG